MRKSYSVFEQHLQKEETAAAAAAACAAASARGIFPG